MTFGEKLKNLRNENKWTQEELSNKIETDGRQISRYENDKFLPSADVIIKLAKVFNVSIDYLLLEDAPRRPIIFQDDQLLKKLQELEIMTEDDKKSLIHIIDAIIAKNKFVSLAKTINNKTAK